MESGNPYNKPRAYCNPYTVGKDYWEDGEKENPRKMDETGGPEELRSTRRPSSETTSADVSVGYNNDRQRTPKIDNYDKAAAGITQKNDGNHYENMTFPSNQEESKKRRSPAHQGSTKSLTKFQIAVLVAFILNFALTITAIAIMLQKENKILHKHEALESEYNKKNNNITSKLTAIEGAISNVHQRMNESMMLAEERELRHNKTHEEILKDTRQLFNDSLVLAEEQREKMLKEIFLFIRLAGGRSNYGRVEVFYNGEWGTVCDDSWDTNDATVVCRMLGYQGSATAYQNAYYGEGIGKIWLDDVACTGRETTLWSCDRNDWGTHNCRHSEDASVYCN